MTLTTHYWQQILSNGHDSHGVMGSCSFAGKLTARMHGNTNASSYLQLCASVNEFEFSLNTEVSKSNER